MNQGSTEPMCAIIEGANWVVSEGKADLGTRSVLILRRPTRIGEQARLLGIFGIKRALGGSVLDRAPASTAQGLHRHEPRHYKFYIST